MTAQVRISAVQRAAYLRDGAVLLPSVLSAAEIQALTAALEASYAAPGPMASRLRDGDTAEIRMDQLPSQANPALQQLVAGNTLRAVAGQLLGVNRVHHILDQMFYKPAGRILPTAWHQDTPYLQVKGDALCRLWICCDPSPRETTISVVRGSHRWNVEFRPVEAEDVSAQEEKVGDGFSYDSARFDQSLPKVPRIADYPESFDLLSWDVHPGDIVAFNGNILHGNNHEVPHHPVPRRSFAVLWGTGEIRTIARPGNIVPDMANTRGFPCPPDEPISRQGDAYPPYSLEP